MKTHWLYAIGLGSNRRHGRHGAPEKVIAAALREIGTVRAASPVLATRAFGAAARRFANAAALIDSSLPPPRLLEALKATERRFGRRSGRRWGDRVLDLDILLWSGGAWRGPGLTIPHAGLANRESVLRPLSVIAPGWGLPGSALTIRQLAARLRRPRPVDRRGPAS